ncbi:MAG: response regulator [Oligoflexia bacterium]|nr:response regulator [Oligoflexia bacterium]
MLEAGEVSKWQHVARQVVCDARMFQRLVLIPQLFVFILLMVVGAGLGQSATYNIARLATVAYLVFVNVAVQSHLRQISARLLLYHLTALVVLVEVLAIFLGQSNIIAAAIPGTLTLALLSLLPMRWFTAAYVTSVPAAILASLMLGMCALGDGELGRTIQAFSALIVVMLCVVFAAALKTRGKSGALVQTAETELSAGAELPATDSQAYASGVESQIREEAQLIVADELRSELLWRMPAAVVFLATWQLVLLLLVEDSRAVGLLYAASLAAVSFLLMYRLSQARVQRDLAISSMLLFLAAIGWWCTSLLAPHAVGASELSLLVLVLAIGGVPWPPLFLWSMQAVLVLGIAMAAMRSSEPFLVVVAAACASIISAKSSLMLYHAALVRAATLFLRRCVETGVETLLCVRLLGERLLNILGVEQLLLVSGEQEASVISSRPVTAQATDTAYVRALLEKAGQQRINEGLLAGPDFGPQFVSVFHDWFGFVPRTIIFVRFSAVIKERDQEIYLFCPVGLQARILGVARAFRSVLSLSALIRASLAAARSRFQSSDILLATQRLLSLREQELGDTVHLVNNIAQDVAIQCDLLGRTAGAEERQGLLRSIDNLARNLSTGVSDLKLLRELGRMREATRSEVVPVHAVIEDLTAFTEYRARRRGEEFSLENACPIDAGVKVASREFLETALRTLLRLIVQMAKKGERVLLRVAISDNFVYFEFRYQGNDCGARMRRAFQDPERRDEAESPEESQAAAIGHFVRTSGGTLALSAPEADSRTIAISLPCGKLEGTKTRSSVGQWALLVDDNRQVTDFYARVADALGIPYHVGASVVEAEKIVREHGRPRIVITDIQMGEDSGLQLVRTMRQQFGADLPIIVVSGQASDAYGNAVEEVGATKFLTKPVGRARLFSEIRSLLGLS